MSLVSKTSALVVSIVAILLLPHTLGSHTFLKSYVLPCAIAMIVILIAFVVHRRDVSHPQLISYALSLPAALGTIAFLLSGVWAIRSMSSDTFNFAYHLFGLVPSLIALLLLVRYLPRSNMATVLIVINSVWIALSVHYALIQFALSGINLR